MEVISKIIRTLRKPFPEDQSTNSFLRTNGLISLFVTLFLFVFQPFDISEIDSKKFLICLGFGGVTFVATVCYELIIGRLLGIRNEPAKFTFGKWILYIIGIMLTISIANFFFARSLIGSLQWAYLPQIIFATFSIGIFPVIVLGGISLSRAEKKYQGIADEINSKLVNQPASNYAQARSVFGIPIVNIKYVEALQNYVRIGYVSGNDALVEQTERATLKYILDQVQGSSLVKCHRSFLVNRKAIISISGNAQGLLLNLSDCDKMIPVSRSYVAAFRGRDDS